MISRVSRVSSATQNTPAILLNTSLPVSIKVTEKTGFNRYNLKFHNRNLSTKSQKQLKVGANYWGEIESANDMIVIKNLYEKPEFNESEFLEDGLSFIENLVTNNTLEWLYERVYKELISANSKESFEIYTNILLALQNNTVHIPFIYSGIFGIFQLKKEASLTRIYLLFSNFAPLIFEIKNGNIIKIQTPFSKVARALKQAFIAEILVGDVKPFWQKQTNIIDLKG
ncbi:hypothetical protein [Campylobacter suis]|uniref:Uncharacterized protein n=1 Tax=Campylobacter suis TaxID=2790657 RepID=A0ABN7K4E9_9BACT|nr:hypothetical protein [Campylobacter suis]CAD7286769.1 hypothetical protein LMG8286_00528 [Campylobacter suis]